MHPYSQNNFNIHLRLNQNNRIAVRSSHEPYIFARCEIYLEKKITPNSPLASQNAFNNRLEQFSALVKEGDTNKLVEYFLPYGLDRDLIRLNLKDLISEE